MKQKIILSQERTVQQMWRELPPLHERQSVLIQHREGKWEESWSWEQKLLVQEKYFDTIENTFKTQQDCNKYCFKKNIAQAVTSSKWLCLCSNCFFQVVETGCDLLKLVFPGWWNWLWLIQTGSYWLIKLVVTGSFWMLKLTVISLNCEVASWLLKLDVTSDVVFASNNKTQMN